MEISEGLHGGSGRVRVNDAKVNRCWRRSNMEDIEVWWPGCPAVAENWLVVAIEKSKVGSSWVCSEDCNALIEGSLNLSAVSEAGLVTPSDQNPPFLWLRAGRLDARQEGILPVAES